MADPQVAHDGGTWSMTWSGAATCSRVSPLCPFWPPDGLFDGPRRLWVRPGRGGFLSPSLDGGLPLFELFSPSRRSSSAIRAFRAAISAACAAISAISSSRDGSRCESGFGLIESLNRKPMPLSRKIYRRSHPATQPSRTFSTGGLNRRFWGVAEARKRVGSKGRVLESSVV
jgi:hypothetical protein